MMKRRRRIYKTRKWREGRGRDKTDRGGTRQNDQTGKENERDDHDLAWLCSRNKGNKNTSFFFSFF